MMDYDDESPVLGEKPRCVDCKRPLPAPGHARGEWVWVAHGSGPVTEAQHTIDCMTETPRGKRIPVPTAQIRERVADLKARGLIPTRHPPGLSDADDLSADYVGRLRAIADPAWLAPRLAKALKAAGWRLLEPGGPPPHSLAVVIRDAMADWEGPWHPVDSPPPAPDRESAP